MGLPPRHRPPRRRIPAIGWLIFGILGLIVLPVVVDAAKGFATPTQGCRVWQVTDGDTVKVWCPSRGYARARIRAYDSPELYSPKCSKEWLWAVAATYYLRWQFWKAREIKTVIDGSDHYGRLLMLIFVDGEGVARRMVNANMGRWYDGGQRAGWCA